MANLSPKRTKRCNQSSLVGTLKGTNADTVLQSMRPSARDLNGRPPDTVLQGRRPSAGNLNGRAPDTVLQGMQPSARDLNGRPPDPVVVGGRSRDPVVERRCN